MCDELTMRCGASGSWVLIRVAFLVLVHCNQSVGDGSSPSSQYRTDRHAAQTSVHTITSASMAEKYALHNPATADEEADPVTRQSRNDVELTGQSAIPTPSTTDDETAPVTWQSPNDVAEGQSAIPTPSTTDDETAPVTWQSPNDVELTGQSAIPTPSTTDDETTPVTWQSPDDVELTGQSAISTLNTTHDETAPVTRQSRSDVALTEQSASVEESEDSDRTTATVTDCDAIASDCTTTTTSPVGTPATLPEFYVDLYQCSRIWSDVTVTAGRGAVNMSFGPGRLIPEGYWVCSILVEAPQDTLSLTLYDIDLRSASCANTCVQFAEGSGWDFIGEPLYCGDGSIPPQQITTSSKTVHVKIRSFDGGLEPASLTFKFLSTPRDFENTDVAELRVTETSNRSGYITPPRLPDGVSHLVGLNTSTLLTAAPNEVVMISFVRFELGGAKDCAVEYFGLFAKDGTSRDAHEVVKVCGLTKRLPTAVYQPPVTLTYYSRVYVPGAKLKLLYTVHKDAEKPRQLPNGRFDCSTAAFSFFAGHLRCNLETECQRGEDELGCSYSSARCGGGILSGNTCYSYVTWLRPLSWSEARDACRSRGAHLVSLNTREEEERVKRLLALGRRWAPVYVGLRTRDQQSSFISIFYRHVRSFDDGTVAYYVNLPRESSSVQTFPTCAAFTAGQRPAVETCGCDSALADQFLCEFHPEAPEMSLTTLNSAVIQLADLPRGTHRWSGKFDVVLCSEGGGHVVHDFLSCDPDSACGVARYPETCTTRQGGEVELFECDDGLRTVAFTLLCDFLRDCLDGSDETFCRHAPTCTGHACLNGQCVTTGQVCDGMGQCTDLSDEERCVTTRYNRLTADARFPRVPIKESAFPSPSLLTLDGHGYFTQQKMDVGQPCPDTHFRCAGSRGNCVPVYVRCNGVHDCPTREDEAACDRYSCPGYYRCRGSQVCLHPDHVCDGVFQCPQQDDELLCGRSCPEGCRCQGLALVCRTPVPPGEVRTSLRYLDASGSGMAPWDLESSAYLVSLRLSRCGLRHAHNITLPNLRHLDLSDNHITSLSMDDFLSLPNLRSLRLSSNPVRVIKGGERSEQRPLLQAVDLSLVLLEVFDAEIFTNFPNVQHLNLSFSKLREIGGHGFKRMLNLKTLNLEGCSALTAFPRDIFQGLSSLEIVRADNYKLCCKDTLPEKFNVEYCHAPEDEVSSCQSLLRSDVYRTFLWLLASLAVAGNGFTLVFRLRGERGRAATGFGVFVVNLSLADLLMGVYLVIVGAADQVYLGSYLWEDDDWKSSVVCQIAGFLSLMSNEVSAFIICLITLDRVIVICSPFTTLRFRKWSAGVACGIAWAAGALLAAVPLLPLTSSWQFYGQSGICIPLPITRRNFPGQAYSFALVIVFNFVLFLLIAAGQAVIYWSVKRNSMTSETSKRSRELNVARRLLTVVMTDFLCWFPIGLLGILASRGVPISGEVNVAMAIFVLPLNSALNPFLYTFNTVMEKRREREKAQLTKILEARLRTEMSELGSRASNKTA